MNLPVIVEDRPSQRGAIRALSLFDRTPHERFDRLTRLAKRAFNVPTAKVTLVAPEMVHTLSCAGGDRESIARERSFCAHTVMSDEIIVIPDTRLDDRFSDNPYVTGEPHVRFYAGCPLTVMDGQRLGSLCLIDVNPREMTHEDMQLLKDLATTVEHELSAIHMAIVDDLTGLSNRRGFEVLAQQALNSCRRLRRPASLLFFDLNDFKVVNDDFGHAEGDKALCDFAEALRLALRDSDIIGRLGGDEFVALLLDSSPGNADKVIGRLDREIADLNACMDRGYDVKFSVGQVNYDGLEHIDVSELLASGDIAMYSHKRKTKGKKLNC